MLAYGKLDREIGVAIMVIALIFMMVGAEPVLAQAPAGANAQFDLTGNGIIDDADAHTVARARLNLQQRGQCITPETAAYDFNGDGCIDIADIQLVLAHWGERTGAVDTPADQDDLGILATKVFTVNSDDDHSDNNLNDGECNTSNNTCTLRAAIQQSNARQGAEEIRFNIRRSDGSCPDRVTIRPAADPELAIDDPRNEGVVIDGYTQCNAKPNTSSGAGNAEIKIQIEGRSSGYSLTINSGNNVVRGLALYNGFYQILLQGQRAANNRIEGNFIGLNGNGDCVGAGEESVSIRGSANRNTIGGTTPQARNIVGCSVSDAFELFGQDSDFNVIIGNFIGVKQDGVTKAGNQADGIDMEYGSSNNRVGGSTAAERNIISGNGRDGIEISHTTLTNNNSVIGNYIGLDVTGTKGVGNKYNGITLEDKINNNYIHSNVIVDNGANGIRGYGLCNDHQFFSNRIGLRPDGTPLPNGSNPGLELGTHGFYLFGGCQRNIIRNNIIAHAPGHGILLTRQESYLNYSKNTDYNTFTRNSIYNNGFVGIRLQEDGNKQPNQGIRRPQISFANTTTVIGQACPNCRIEIFIADKTTGNTGDNAGEGKTFIGEGVANGLGEFRITFGGVQVGQYITGTATDSAGNTSEFGINVRATSNPAPAPTPIPTPKPTATPTRRPQSAPPDISVWVPIIFK
jgi:CSLREA domain-containing protein